jgi:hypothetical protein
MTGRTVAGVRAYAKVLGFEDFLGRVEKDQIERLENAPELFEKYLPYPMALRVEKKWVAAFSSIGMQLPQWYQLAEGSSFQPSLIVNDLGMMSSQAGSVMTSSSRSSGGGVAQALRAAQDLVTAEVPEGALAVASVVAVVAGSDTFRRTVSSDDASQPSDCSCCGRSVLLQTGDSRPRPGAIPSAIRDRTHS